MQGRHWDENNIMFSTLGVLRRHVAPGIHKVDGARSVFDVIEISHYVVGAR